VSAPVVAVFAGGISREREVSLRSAEAVRVALEKQFPVEVFVIDRPEVPAGLQADSHVVFSTLHGVFGEDGGMQSLLDERGIEYAGSDTAASRLCMDKTKSKSTVSSAGVLVPRGLVFPGGGPPSAGEILSEFGPRVVLKPNGEGSSIGLRFAEGEGELTEALRGLDEGDWLVEEQIVGRELTVGVLDGGAMGVVEIIPDSGRYDYESKYTKGLTRYQAPADLPEETAREIRRAAETAFALCGCRDFARVDFILEDNGPARFLEVNTLPGLTGTSLLPMSAACEGLDFNALARRLVMPAWHRFNSVKDKVKS
jgi:D-alanine-D-alanine ligase